MQFSVMEKLIWVSTFSLNAVLVLVLLARGRWRQFPTLTLWLIFLLLRTLVLFVVYLHGSKYWYAHVYWVGASIDFALQLAVVFEIARIVLRPTGTWVHDARGYFATVGLAGILVAAVFARWVSPPSPDIAHRVWEIRGNLFTSLVICELFVVMTFTANRLGLAWRNHVMAVGQGLTAWSAVMVAKTAIQSFLGTRHLYIQVEYIRGVTYVAAVCWMIVQLWRDEPERQPISSDLQEYILALHKRVEYDLRRLDARH